MVKLVFSKTRGFIYVSCIVNEVGLIYTCKFRSKDFYTGVLNLLTWLYSAGIISSLYSFQAKSLHGYKSYFCNHFSFSVK
jgi:hypothetical protein